MSVILGHMGQVELRRSTAGRSYTSEICPSDVNLDRNRFSFEFTPGMLLTGDQVEFKALDRGPLDFVEASGWFVPGTYPDGIWFVAVDQVGGVTLYRTFDEAVSGEASGRVMLQRPSRKIPIAVKVRNNIERIVGQVTDFTLNTSREAVDVTELGDEFRQQHSALISGSGQLNCFFDYERRLCDELSNVVSGGIEMPIYLHQLLLRTEMGSEFWAKLTLAGRDEAKPGGYAEDVDDEVYYDFNALVTNVAIAFEATQPVRTTVDFVTTGEIKLRTRMISNYILQEDDVSRIRVEENLGSGFLELEEAQQE
jgi:hypothetical protein